MRVLLYSAVVYLLGVAIVLYLRPSLMFKHSGEWKEFGVQGVDTTYFPFWLFCIVWAVVAHALIRIFYSDGSIDTVATATTMASLTARIDDPSPAHKATPLEPLQNSLVSAPTVPVEPTEEAKPGYYKLDSSLMKRKGIPRYIYVGEDKPSDLE